MPGLDTERDVAVSWGDGVVALDTTDLAASRQGLYVCVCVCVWVVRERERERERASERESDSERARESLCVFVWVCFIISVFIC